jgi:hypothetical protein
MAVRRTTVHRHETPEGVLTWSVNVRLTANSPVVDGLPTDFELDGEPLTVSEGRAIKRRYAILD